VNGHGVSVSEGEGSGRGGENGSGPSRPAMLHRQSSMIESSDGFWQGEYLSTGRTATCWDMEGSLTDTRDGCYSDSTDRCESHPARQYATNVCDVRGKVSW
jgi:hypothetical protein